MAAYIIPHPLKARLHNILADVYNHDTNPRKFPTPPSIKEVYQLMVDLDKIPLAQIDVHIRNGQAFLDDAPVGVKVSVIDLDEEEERL